MAPEQLVGKGASIRSDLGSWTRASRMEEFKELPFKSQRVIGFLLLMLLVAILLGAIFLARRHFRQGRGDRKGAFRLSAFIFLTQQLAWMFSASQVPDFREEIVLIGIQLALSLLAGGTTWLLYLALEPYLRRYWPERIISWNRPLSGRFRDPLVGRDVLLGGAVGAGLEILALARNLAHEWLGQPPAQPFVLGATESLLGGRFLGAALIDACSGSVLFSMMLLFLFLLLKTILRKQWLAVVAILLWGMGIYGVNLPNVVDTLFGAVFAALVLFLLIRFGLLAMIAGLFLGALLETYPLTLDLSSWYAGSFFFAMASAAAVYGYAFFIVRAGHPIVSDGVLSV